MAIINSERDMYCMIEESEKAYTDSNIGGWYETDDSCKKEDIKWDIYNWWSQIDEKIGQCWGNSQEEHVVEQLVSMPPYLISIKDEYQQHVKVKSSG